MDAPLAEIVERGPHDFTPYSATHAISVAACAFLAGVVIAQGLRARARGTEEAQRRRLAPWIIPLWALMNVYYMIPFTPWRSLPLQVCDLGGLLAAVALMGDRRWARSLLYFWGLVLSSQAFVQPVLTVGPSSLEFWIFWLAHAIIVGGACYELIVRRFRPDARDLVVAIAISLAYLAAMFVLDRSTGWNYAYVGPTKPDQPTLVDRLGPYPLRVLWMILIGTGAFVLAYLPWAIAARRRREA